MAFYDTLMRAFAITALLMTNVAWPAAAAEIPPGGYQNSCTNIQVQKLLGGSGRNLTASCQKKSGKYVDAILPLPCAGDIQNRNGKLICVPGDNPFGPPDGSYQTMCKNVSMAGPILRGRCRSAMSNIYVTTSINTLDCRGADIRVKPTGELAC